MYTTGYAVMMLITYIWLEDTLQPWARCLASILWLPLLCILLVLLAILWARGELDV